MKKTMKSRYAEGLDCMRMGEGLPQMMYIVCIICGMLIFYKLDPTNANAYATNLGINLILVYLYSGIFPNNNSGVHRIVKFLVFIILELILIIKTSAFSGLLTAVAIFIVPIVVAFWMIYLTESNSIISNMFEFIEFKEINSLGTVIIVSLLPTMIIAIPLFLLEWSVFVKIAIIVGYIFATPLICYGDSKELSIFGAMGFEW